MCSNMSTTWAMPGHRCPPGQATAPCKRLGTPPHPPPIDSIACASNSSAQAGKNAFHCVDRAHLLLATSGELGEEKLAEESQRLDDLLALCTPIPNQPSKLLGIKLKV